MKCLHNCTNNVLRVPLPRPNRPSHPVAHVLLFLPPLLNHLLLFLLAQVQIRKQSLALRVVMVVLTVTVTVTVTVAVQPDLR